jgi:hypothetical protein
LWLSVFAVADDDKPQALEHGAPIDDRLAHGDHGLGELGCDEIARRRIGWGIDMDLQHAFCARTLGGRIEDRPGAGGRIDERHRVGHEADRTASGADGGQGGIDDKRGIGGIDVDDGDVIGRGVPGSPEPDVGLALRALPDMGKGASEQFFERLGAIEREVLLVGRFDGIGQKARKSGFGFAKGRDALFPVACQRPDGFGHGFWPLFAEPGRQA